ncbi:phage tail tape measure protein [Brevibacillus brevis]|uniref:phage tail tape measure protein n=1 Tax=Brevibacillus brevis TaxID=1393 RepID=UPI001C8DF087|nr:phage tail tape measure protein [Brevibacillus brevis]MBY0088394.1 phage tail tape measure protein [Brevibacillus brevis]
MARKIHEMSFLLGGRIAGSFKGAFASASSQIRSLGNDAKNLRGALRTLEERFKNGEITADAYRKSHQQLTSQIDKTAQAHQRLSRVTQRQNELQQQASRLHSQAFDTAVMATPLVATAQAAMKFEDSMLGVARQVQGARDENGKLTQVYYDMGKQIQQLGREIPIATNEIADMVTAGARMGVAKDELIGFTKTSSMMATAFEMPAGELAEQMGKIAGLYKIPIPAIDELADSINYLDDNAISKGGDIIDFMQRTGGVSSSVKVTGKEMAALGSTLLTLGERTETAGTAVNAIFSKLAAADKGTKKFKEAMAEIGLSTSEVQKGMQKDAMGTLAKVMQAVGKMPQDKQLGIMVELVGLEHSDTMAKLAGNTKELNRQLALANGEAAKGSMGREFAARLQTSSAQMQLMKNSATETAVAFGQVLLPPLNQAFGVISQVAQGAAAFAETYPNVTKVIVLGTTAVIGSRIAWIGLKFAWTQAALMGNGLQSLFIRQAVAQTTATTATAVAAATTGKLTIAQRLLNLTMMMNPIGLVVTAIGGLVAAGIYLYNNWDTAKAKAIELWQTIDNNPLLSIALGPIKGLIEAGISLYNNWDHLKQGAMDMGISISNHFKSMANGIIQSVNKISSGINSLTGTSLPQLQEFQLDYSVQARKMDERRSARNMGMEIPAYANGGILTRPHIGMVAEAGPEAVIPLNGSRRAASLWQQAGDALGMSRGGTVIHLNYSPVFHGGTKEELEPMVQQDKRNLLQELKAINNQGRRVSYAG